MAARREQARSIGDVMLRRTRLGLLAAHDLTGASSDRGDGHTQPTGPDPVLSVATVLGSELGWDSQRIASEIDRFAAEMAAEGLLGRSA